MQKKIETKMSQSLNFTLGYNVVNSGFNMTFPTKGHQIQTTYFACRKQYTTQTNLRKKFFEDLNFKISLPQLRFFILVRKLLLLQNIVQRSSESRSTNASDKGFAERPQ